MYQLVLYGPPNIFLHSCCTVLPEAKQHGLPKSTPEPAAEKDSYQGREEYAQKEPALTAEDQLLYADQQPPDWEVSVAVAQ